MMGLSLILVSGNSGHGGGNERREFGGFSFRERGRYGAAVEMIIIRNRKG
jgi:hypothetical protein